MDKIIDSNFSNNSLENDVPKELRFSSNIKCPDDSSEDDDKLPVVLVNTRSGKKDRNIRARHLVCLLDGGATNSFILSK